LSYPELKIRKKRHIKLDDLTQRIMRASFCRITFQIFIKFVYITLGRKVTFAAGVELQPRAIVVRLVIDITEDADARLPHGWILNGVETSRFQFQRHIDTRSDRLGTRREWIARENYCRAKHTNPSALLRRVLRNSAARSYAAKILSMSRGDDVTWHTRD